MRRPNFKYSTKFQSETVRPACVQTDCVCSAWAEAHASVSYHKNSKIQIYFVITNISVMLQISRGWKSLPRGVTTRSVASRKVANREVRTKGSETAKSGTDEQKVHKRHYEKDEYPQQYDVQHQQSNADSSQRWFSWCRCTRDWMKENALTRGGLGIDSVSICQEVSRGHSTL